ncbi:Calreticulin [Microtus ochrogaster]|uniref:Calreticulin n=1 Tax=Microtus ochrogaster TaxID=79684 RepID=A0A8J6KTR1_MICOH|nr:Calreticulin [Microtus ochrogaster]
MLQLNSSATTAGLQQELQTMESVVCADLGKAEEFGNETWGVTKAAEKQMKDKQDEEQRLKEEEEDKKRKEEEEAEDKEDEDARDEDEDEKEKDEDATAQAKDEL